MQEMGTTPQLTWGVDDSAYAIQTMRTAGMATVGLFDRDDTSTFEQLNAAADVVARSFDELELRLFTENIRSA
jgi:beta-phosphoglucomutase-like phosphatase (HAD superfamily)